MKVCKGPCARLLPLDAFPPAKKAADGHRSRCRECVRIYWRAWASGKHEPKRAMATIKSPKSAKLEDAATRLLRDPAMLPAKRRLIRTAAAALVEQGVEACSAELVVDLILRGKVPHLAVDLNRKEQQA